MRRCSRPAAPHLFNRRCKIKVDNPYKIHYHMRMGIIGFEHLNLESGYIPVRILYFPNEKLYPKCDLHWHEELEFYVITKGKMLLCCGDKEQWLSAGDIGFAHWCEPHCALRFSENTERYIVQINPSFLNLTEPLKKQKLYYDIFTLNSDKLGHFFLNNKGLFDLFMCLIAEMQKTPAVAELTVIGLLFQIISIVYESSLSQHSLKELDAAKKKADQKHITRMLLYIREHSMQQIILEDLARAISLSVSYMCRLFKAYMGDSIIIYANKIKIERAVALMLNGYDFTTIYQQLGFDDYNYFARTFKKYKKLSPAGYLQRCSSLKNKGNAD